jgi:superfamily II RNA helicase
VIFDEVHIIGKDDGDVWERFLKKIKGPFLALTATIGGENNYHAW